MSRILLASNGYGEDGIFLGHAKTEILDILGSARQVVFIPYSWPERDWDDYHRLAANTLQSWGYECSSLHHSPDQASAIRSTDTHAIIVGGGNTFRLLTSLYKQTGLIDAIRARVKGGLPYVGVSAGSIMLTPALMTSGASRPVVYPPTHRGLAIVPHLIVPHYVPGVVTNPGGATRLKGDEELWEMLNSLPPGQQIMGLPDGCMLRYNDRTFTVHGTKSATRFQAPDISEPLPPGSQHSLHHMLHLPDSVVGPVVS